MWYISIVESIDSNSIAVSEVMMFGTKSKKERFRLGESELKIVETYKYLGLVLDKNFTWRAHLQKVCDKARKRMQALSGLGLREGVSAKAMLRGWEVLVRPVLEYGAEI